MVDVSVLQSVSYIVAAIGVCIAAGYYVMNLRETNKNRRITFTNTVIQQMQTEEGTRRFFDCIHMEWSSFEDFKKKYDSRVNPESFSKRVSLWSQCDSLGYLYKSNLIDIDTIYNIGGRTVETVWTKFKPIIEEYRGNDFSPNAYRNFEYLAEAMGKMRREREGEGWKFLEQVKSEPGKR